MDETITFDKKMTRLEALIVIYNTTIVKLLRVEIDSKLADRLLLVNPGEPNLLKRKQLLKIQGEAVATTLKLVEEMLGKDSNKEVKKS